MRGVQGRLAKKKQEREEVRRKKKKKISVCPQKQSGNIRRPAFLID